MTANSIDFYSEDSVKNDAWTKVFNYFTSLHY